MSYCYYHRYRVCDYILSVPVGTANVPAATNGFASSSSSQIQFHSATAVHSALRPTSARSTASERSHHLRSTVPPTPPTRDRTRAEPYTDRNSSRCSLELTLLHWCEHAFKPLDRQMACPDKRYR